MTNNSPAAALLRGPASPPATNVIKKQASGPKQHIRNPLKPTGGALQDNEQEATHGTSSGKKGAGGNRPLPSDCSDLVALRPITPAQEMKLAEYMQSVKSGLPPALNLNDWPNWLGAQVLQLLLPLRDILVPKVKPGTFGSVAGEYHDLVADVATVYWGGRHLLAGNFTAVEGGHSVPVITTWLLIKTINPVSDLGESALLRIATRFAHKYVRPDVQLGVPLTIATSPHGEKFDIVGVVIEHGGPTSIALMYRFEF
jgi:hypothetical protein